MNIKKIISVGLSVLTIATSVALPAYAAKSANPDNEQISSKVKQFNNSRLQTLDYYIWQININSDVVSDVVDLYKRLDNLVVSDIATANSLTVPANAYDANSIGSKLDLLFAFLHQLDTNLKFINAKEKPSNHILNSKISNVEASIKSIIVRLNSEIDEIEIFND